MDEEGGKSGGVVNMNEKSTGLVKTTAIHHRPRNWLILQSVEMQAP